MLSISFLKITFIYNIISIVYGGFMKNLEFKKPIYISSVYHKIPSYTELEKIGAGHDGIVYRYGSLVYKLLKYNIQERKQKDLMTFEKVQYFIENVKLSHITQPIDILLDTDGMYIGYVMKYFDDITKKANPIYSTPGSLPMKKLEESISILREDVQRLTKAHIIIQDLNRGSYIYTEDGINMCDVDKFRIIHNGRIPHDLNRASLNFFIAKALFYEREKSNQFSKDELKVLLQWVKKSANTSEFLKSLSKDCQKDPNYPIGEYAKEKGMMLIHK